MDVEASIEGAFARLQEFAAQRAELVSELEGSRVEFFADGGLEAWTQADQRAHAARRHAEWFLLERPSDVLGGVPAEVLVDGWADEHEPAVTAALLGTRAGVFEVRSVDPGRGFVLSDLGGAGDLDVDEADAAGEMQAGDLLVGRAFPVGGRRWRISPVSTCWRDAELLSALRTDFERAREARRGSVRVSQAELERLFHPPPEPGAVSEPEDVGTALVEAGLAPGEAEAVLDQLAAVEPEHFGVAVNELLDRVAFETSADLEAVRRALLAARGVVAGDTADEPARATAALEADPREALAAFDRGRAEGQDLDALFDALERDLGLDAGAGVDDAGAVPDFPGVVGAVVEEFLWELGVRDADAAERHAGPLRLLARYGAGIGLFEELDARRVLDFAARWALESGELRDANTAKALVAALEAFRAWCADSQQHDLGDELEAWLTGLERSLPRLAALRDHAFRGAAPGESERDVHRLVRDDEGRAAVVDRGGDPVDVALSGPLAAGLEEGDLVRVTLVDGRGVVDGCFPPECAALLVR